MRKINGRPLLPWWVYALYFAFAITVAVWHNVAHGDEMKPATGKTAEKAKHGRNGDRILAHINPMEAAILKAMGGAGTTNPKTGYKEYYDATDAGFDIAAGDFGGAGAGLASETGSGSAPAGGTQGTGGLDSTSIGLDLARGNYLDTGLGIAGQAPTVGPTGGQQGTGGFSINPINNLRNEKLAGPTLAGILGGQMFGGLAYGAQAINDRFFDGKARTDVDMNAGGPNNMGDAIAGALNTQPVAAPLPSFMRPAEEPPPPAFGMAGGMTDLQKRAQIATGGTQGNTGQFRTPEAMRYYGNLIARALIGDNNAVAQQSPNLLPIEDTYLKQVFGVTPQNNSATLLDALKPYWSR